MFSSLSVTRSAGALLILAALTLSGCTTKQDAPSRPVAGEQPSVPRTTPDPATAAGTPTALSETTPAAPATLTDRLLTADAVPGLNAAWHWQDGETGPADAEPFGTCAKVDLMSIGATRVLQRTFFPPVDTDDGAAEQVAEFADTTSAAQAASVLKSWQKACAKTPRPGMTTKVGTLTAVDGGSWYLVTTVPANKDEGVFESLGIVLSGTRLAVLKIDVIGQDFNYPAGREPMVRMIRAAADLLAT